MPYRIKSNKKKNYAGNRFYGAGNAKNRRGKGNKGGKGRAGIRTHKWFKKIKEEGTKTPKGFINYNPSHMKELTTHELDKMTGSDFILKHTKIIYKGELTRKVNVTALKYTEKAKKAIEAKGGIARSFD